MRKSEFTQFGQTPLTDGLPFLSVTFCGSLLMLLVFHFFFSSRRRHTRLQGDWSSDVCSSDLIDRYRRSEGETPADRVPLCSCRRKAGLPAVGGLAPAPRSAHGPAGEGRRSRRDRKSVV